MSAQLPTLDLSLFTRGTDAQRQTFCLELVDSLRKFGFVRCVNYGINPNAVNKLFDVSKDFFDLTHDEKMTAAHPARPNPHRGYSFVGQEITSTLSRPQPGEAAAPRKFDVKETFDQGSPHDRLFPNIYPQVASQSDFQPTLDNFFEACHQTHMHILDALAVGLGLPPHRFSSLHQQRDSSELRLLHYPAVAAADIQEQGFKTRISEHTDAGSITLLFQDDCGGLEIEDQRPGHDGFIPVSSHLPTVLINVGDSMQHWTNDEIRAVWHRVTLPKDSTGEDSSSILPARYSVAYFGKPDRDASVGCFEEFVSADRPARYKDVSALEWNQRTLLKTY
ncbi:hypothetical protein H9L39_02327 [Fusarium oxysporum f. sp. albedinis]|nr:hypothetical protein H9L39_02327 [Fusarium oxysporum f. sp. albedinis]